MGAILTNYHYTPFKSVDNGLKSKWPVVKLCITYGINYTLDKKAPNPPLPTANDKMAEHLPYIPRQQAKQV